MREAGAPPNREATFLRLGPLAMLHGKRATDRAQLNGIFTSRRAIRRYDGREVDEGIVRSAIDSARTAPSSMDGQPCCFIVVRDAKTKRAIADTKDRYCPVEKRDYPARFVAHAPVVVAVCVERDRSHGRERENGILAAGFLMLAAADLGLGSVYLCAYRDGQPDLARELSQLLGLPAGVAPIALIPLGYPPANTDEAPAPKGVRPLDEIIHREVYRTR